MNRGSCECRPQGAEDEVGHGNWFGRVGAAGRALEVRRAESFCLT